MLIFEKSVENRIGYSLPEMDIDYDNIDINKNLLSNEKLDLPEISENEVVRHYTELSTLNFGVDTGMYPLGSCTMKYNPKINEKMARLEGFNLSHPDFPLKLNQGSLELIYNLQELLCKLTGFSEFTLQPAAGAHGEYVGISIIKKYHKHKNNFSKNTILVPSSAHGTNPATAAMCNFKIQEIKTDKRGNVDIEDLKLHINENVAGLMLTNPNTLGLLDENIFEITKLVHSVDGLLYYDGANFNAIMGYYRPGDMGFDICHLNLHKTFSTPHGGGGPGSGPVGVIDRLSKYLPYPKVIKDNDFFKFVYDKENSIGKVKAYYGNFSVLVRAYTYILMLGKENLKLASEMAVLNANYIQEKLKKYFHLEYDRECMHEFVLSSINLNKFGIHTLDIAKRLIDLGYHPPTIYFPLIIEEAMMIEPTETESKRRIDDFINAMIKVAKEAEDKPDILHNSPITKHVKRLDEAKAAKDTKLTYSCSCTI